MEWQPIKTMPVDREVLIAWRNSNNEQTVCRYKGKLPAVHGWTHWLEVPELPPIPLEK